MTDHCPADQYPPLGVAPMPAGKKKYNEIVVKSSPQAKIPDSELDALARKLKEIYPTGKKEDRWHWAEGIPLIKKRLQNFFVKYGRYPSEDIIDATQRYVDEMKDKEDMRLLKYFIYKDKRENGEIIYTSDLITWMENKDEEVRSSDWMLHT